jgi:hypothetical protein
MVSKVGRWFVRFLSSGRKSGLPQKLREEKWNFSFTERVAAV